MTSRIEPVRASGNLRRAQLAVAAVGAIPAVAVFVVVLLLSRSVVVSLLLAVAVGLVVSVGAWTVAPRRALAGIAAREATPEEFPRLHNLVDGLCAIAGVTKPELLVRDDPQPDACSLGTGREDAVLVVTTGLLGRLTRIELEGVLAHELAHIKQLDIAPATLIAGLGSTVAGAVVRPVLGRGSDPSALGREPCADLDGVRLTRYPPGLIAALEKLEDEGVPARADDYPWLSSEERPEERRFRIDVLREL